MANWVLNRIFIHVERGKKERWTSLFHWKKKYSRVQQQQQRQHKNQPKTICFQPNFLCLLFCFCFFSTKKRWIPWFLFESVSIWCWVVISHQSNAIKWLVSLLKNEDIRNIQNNLKKSKCLYHHRNRFILLRVR